MGIPPSTRARVDWLALRNCIKFYVDRQLQNVDDAEDLADECIRVLLEPSGTNWDPARGTIEAFALGIAKNKILELHRQRRRTQALHSKVAQAAAVHSLANSTVDRVLDGKRFLEGLRNRLSTDGIALAVLTESAAGFEKPQELATRLGVDVKVIKNAKLRIRRVQRTLRNDLNSANRPQRSG